MQYKKILNGATCYTLALGVTIILSAGGAWGNERSCDVSPRGTIQNDTNVSDSLEKSPVAGNTGIWNQDSAKSADASGATPVYLPNPKVDCKSVAIKPDPSLNCKIRAFGLTPKEANTATNASPPAKLPAVKSWNSAPCDTPSGSPGATTVTPDPGSPSSKE